MAKVQLATKILLLGGAAMFVICQHRSQVALRGENQLLREELAQLTSDNERLSGQLGASNGAAASRLAVTSMRTGGASESEAALPASPLIASMLHGGEAPRLTGAQLEHYLDENHRSAASLLSAYRTSGDRALLKEAVENYPGDARVAFEAAMDKDAAPAERRPWLEAFKKAAPENPLANYLSALDYFKSGQSDQAVQELTAASTRAGFADYTLERIQADVEAYRGAGYSEAEAKMAATWGIALPQLAQMKALAQSMVGVAGSYRQGGDAQSEQAMLQMVIGLGRQLDSEPGSPVPLVTRLVGISVEGLALGAMDPSAAYGEGTVRDQFDRLAQRRTSIRGLVQQSVPFQEQMTSQDWLNYNERTLGFGEENALTWLLNKYGQR